MVPTVGVAVLREYTRGGAAFLQNFATLACSLPLSSPSWIGSIHPSSFADEEEIERSNQQTGGATGRKGCDIRLISSTANRLEKKLVFQYY